MMKGGEDQSMTPSVLQEAMECGVCLNPYQRPVQLMCGHTYCENCVNTLAALPNQEDYGIGRAFDALDQLRGDWMRVMGGVGMPPVMRRIARNERRIEGEDGEEGEAGQNMGNNAPQQIFEGRIPPNEMMLQQPFPGPMMGHPMGGNRVGLGGEGPHMQQAPVVMQMAAQPHPQQVRPMNMIMQPGAFAAQWQQHQPMIQRQQIQQRVYVGGVRAVPNNYNQPPYRRAAQIACPECRQITQIPANGLPVNYKLQDLIERVRRMNPKPIGCICSECGSAISGNVYFSCHTPDCTNKAETICSMCGLRNHNGHIMVENRVLTEDEVAEERKNVAKYSVKAAMLSDECERLRNAIHRHTDVADVLKDAMKKFTQLEQELERNESFTQETASLRSHKASRLFSVFEDFIRKFRGLENRVNQEASDQVNDFINETTTIMELTSCRDDRKGGRGEKKEATDYEERKEEGEETGERATCSGGREGEALTVDRTAFSARAENRFQSAMKLRSETTRKKLLAQKKQVKEEPVDTSLEDSLLGSIRIEDSATASTSSTKRARLLPSAASSSRALPRSPRRPTIFPPRNEDEDGMVLMQQNPMEVEGDVVYGGQLMPHIIIAEDLERREVDEEYLGGEDEGVYLQ